MLVKLHTEVSKLANYRTVTNTNDHDMILHDVAKLRNR
jgi:hypothetical protein